MKRRFRTFSLILVFMFFSSLMPKYQAFGYSDGFTNGIELVSVTDTGEQGNGDSVFASTSRDGRYVAFESGASNLISGDMNYGYNIYVVDRQTKVVQCVSVSNDGTYGNSGSYDPCISDDGRVIAFASTADNLVPGDNNNTEDIFVYDRLNNKIEIVSISNEGHLGTGGNKNSPHGAISISSNGRFVVFGSSSNDLVPGDNDDSYDIFIYDRQDKKIERVGAYSSEGFVDTYPYRVTSISGDGRLVVFDSTLDNLVEGDDNRENDVFIYDRLTKEIKRISVSCNREQGIGGGFDPSISIDGKFVVFSSNADDLVSDDTNQICDIFLYDVQNTSIQRIKYDINESIGYSYPDISEDGRYVVCQSDQSYTSNCILVYDRMNDKSHNVTIAYDGGYPNAHSYYPKISSDAQFIFFTSEASNLIKNDYNNYADVFITSVVPLNPEPTPQLSIQSPLQGENIRLGKKTITASASGITLDHIYVYLTDNAGNEIPVGTQPGNSFSIEYDFQQPGSYSINAVGSTTPNRTDPSNQLIYAQSINVTVTGEMSVKFTGPEDNKSFPVGEKINFSAIASGLKYVQFFYKNVDNPNDWGQIGSDLINQTDCNVTWDTLGKAAGRYLIKVQEVNEPNQLPPLCSDEIYINLKPSVTIESPVSIDPLELGEHEIKVSAAGSVFEHIFVSIKDSNNKEVYGVTKDGNSFNDSYNFAIPGKYTIYAMGKLSVPDKNGNSLIPAIPVEVTVNVGGPISITITSPDKPTYPAGTITVKVEGKNCDHIYVYGKKPSGDFFAIGTQYTNHFSKDWDFLGIGTYTIYAAASSDDPNAEPVYAKEVSINVIPAPEIKITALNGNTEIEPGKPIEIELGKLIEFELNAKNCDHINININNGLLDKNIKCTSNDFTYKDNFTPSSAGEYKITVSGRNTPNENDLGTKRVQDEVIVNVGEKVPVSSVTIKPNENYIGIGEGITLEAIVLPKNASDPSMTWTSSNENIAKIDTINGTYGTLCTITGINEGTATITATSKMDKSKVGTCVVRVTHDITPVQYAAFSLIAYSDFTNEDKYKDIKNLNVELGDKRLWDSSHSPYYTRKMFYDREIGTWQIIDILDEDNTDEQSSFYGLAFKNHLTNQVVITIRGTDSSDGTLTSKQWWDDIKDDAPLAFGSVTDQAKDALRLYGRVQEIFPDVDITLTGHSLGGALAHYVSLHTGKKAVTFNAPSITKGLFLAEYKTINFHGFDKWNIIDYVNEHDNIVGCIGDDIDKTAKLYCSDEIPSATHFVPFHGHGVESMLEPGPNGSVVLTQSIINGSLPNPPLTDDKVFLTRYPHPNLMLGTSRSNEMRSPSIPKGTMIFGGDGNDFLFGGIGIDDLIGGDGYDELYGGINDDALRGGNDSDELYGQDGNDILIGGDGSDYMDGGKDNDTYYFGNYGDSDCAADIFGDDNYVVEQGCGNISITDYVGVNTIILNNNLYFNQIKSKITSTKDNFIIKMGSDVVTITIPKSGTIVFENPDGTLVRFYNEGIPVAPTPTQNPTKPNPGPYPGKPNPLPILVPTPGLTRHTAQCPVNLEIYTKDGELISKITDEFATNPVTLYGNFYSFPEENGVSKVAYLYDSNFDIKILGTGSGTMDYTIEDFDHNGNLIKTTKYKDIPITPNSIISSDAGKIKTEINIDSNGDGVIDEKYRPLEVISVSEPIDDSEPTSHNSPIYNYVLGIKLDKTNMAIKIGEKVTLSAEISPTNANNKELIWISSNPIVVTVDNGVITAINPGSSVITVKTVDGGFTASCTVNVEEDKIKVTGVSLDKDTASIKVGESIQLKAQVMPENANNKEVAWSSSNKDIASVDVNGRITALKEGKAIITVRTADGGHEDSFTVDVIANTTNTKPPVVKKEVIITASKLNVRIAPTTKSKIVGSVLKGQRLEYLGIENGWYKVVFSGTTAYVYGQYASQIGIAPSLIIKQVVVIARSGLTVRDKAQANGRRIGLLRYGTKINAIELVNGWYKIIYNGRTGYINSKYVK